jgi:glutathione S-transferase
LCAHPSDRFAERYHDETIRLLDVLEIQLSGRHTGIEKDYLAGSGRGRYSIADIVSFPWARAAKRLGIEEEALAKLPHLQKWINRIEEREAVKIALGDKYNIKKD